MFFATFVLFAVNNPSLKVFAFCADDLFGGSLACGAGDAPVGVAHGLS